MATARRDNKNRHQHSNHNHNNQNDSDAGDSFEEEGLGQESQEFDSSENADQRSRKRKRGGYEGPTPAPIDLVELKKKAISDLIEVAKGLGVENTGGLKKQNLIFAILQAQAERDGQVHAAGVMEKLPDGYGFLRSPDYNYVP
ncbi:Rho termination factor N-terminal domain-containing protein, partial [Leptospira ellisii]